jgi:hypothetical protein
MKRLKLNKNVNGLYAVCVDEISRIISTVDCAADSLVKTAEDLDAHPENEAADDALIVKRTGLKLVSKKVVKHSLTAQLILRFLVA